VNDAGGYNLRFTAEITNREDPLYLGTGAVMDYDGRRLVVAGFLEDGPRRYPSCDFYLAVYDKSGLAYYGEYASSLSTGHAPKKYYDRCLPVDYEPITVCWD
jgi:hypothetical protein